MPCASNQTSDVALGSSLKANLPKPHKTQVTLKLHVKAALMGKGSLTNKPASLRSRSQHQAEAPAVHKGQERQAGFQHSDIVWYFLVIAEGVRWGRTHCSVSRAQQFSEASAHGRGRPFPGSSPQGGKRFCPSFLQTHLKPAREGEAHSCLYPPSPQRRCQT